MRHPDSISVSAARLVSGFKSFPMAKNHGIRKQVSASQRTAQGLGALGCPVGSPKQKTILPQSDSLSRGCLVTMFSSLSWLKWCTPKRSPLSTGLTAGVATGMGFGSSDLFDSVSPKQIHTSKGVYVCAYVLVPSDPRSGPGH